MKWQRTMAQALREHGLTHTQFVILAALRWLNLEGQPVVTKSDVARYANVDRMMASKIIRALARRGVYSMNSFIPPANELNRFV